MDTRSLISQGIQLERAGSGGAAKLLESQNSPDNHMNDSDGEVTEFASAYNSESTVDLTDQEAVERAINDDGSEAEATEGTEPKQEAASQDDSKRTVTVTDHKGKREITIDFNDKDKTVKAYQMAAGMRKFQQERDQAQQKLGSVEKDLTEYKTRFDKLEQIYREHGEDGLIRLLSDGKRNLDMVVQERASYAERRAKADPAELAQMDREELERRANSQVSKLEQRIKELEGNLTNTLTAAETQKMESVVHPAFDKFRFAGKLGSAEDEAMFDEMMWNRATKVFDSYREQGIALTPDLVEKEFKKQSVAMSRLVKTQVNDKVSKVIENKKDRAMETVQRQAVRGMTQSKEDKEARDMLVNGNISGFFKKFSGSKR